MTNLCKKITLICFLYFSIFIPSTVCWADTVSLKNGDVMSGLIVSLENDICVFSSSFGATVFFNIKDILSITTERNFDILLKSGESVKGKFLNDAGTTKISSLSLGNIPVQVKSISKMTAIYINKEKENVNNDQGEEKKEFGQNVDKEPPLDFLTGTTVLLRPGVFELDLGFNYKQSKSTQRLPYAGYFERSTYSARQAEVSLSVRAGLWEGAEGSVIVPFSYNQVTDISTSEWVRSKDRYGVGDISIGFQQTIFRESSNTPAITASIIVSAPTGEKNYPELTDSWIEPLDNGRGFWTLNPGISFVKTIDPAIIFGGVNYQYSFENTIDGYRVQPGWGVTGYLGVGFALNDNLSLGARVSQSYFSDMKYEGKIVEGTFVEPMDLAFSASYRISDSWVVSPEVRFGLNGDAGASNIGVRFTTRF